jgi:hypothetical protein
VDSGVFVSEQCLLEQLFQGGVGIRVLLHDLGHSHLKILLSHVDSTLSEGKHSCLSANSLNEEERRKKKEALNTRKREIEDEII